MTTADNALVLYRSDRFRGWIMVTLGNVARSVYGEAGSVSSHAERLALARRVVLNPARWVDRFLNVLIGDVEVAPLGGMDDELWTNEHLLILRTKIGELWTPIALDEASMQQGGPGA